MREADDAPALEDRSEHPPLTARIRSVFVSPGTLADQLRHTAPWFDVLLLSTVIAVVSVLALPEDVFLEPMREAVSRRGEPVEITSSPEEIVRWGRALAMLATVATHPILVFTLAGVFTLVFSILGGGGAGYREYLSLTSHGMLIPALGSALVFLIRLVGGPSFGAFPEIGSDGSLPLLALSALDPFTLWMLIVLGMGIHRLDARHSTARAITVLMAGYLLVVVLSLTLLYPDLGR